MDPSITPNAMSRRDFLQCTAVAASAVSLPLVPAALAAAPAAPGEEAQAFAEPLPVLLKVNGLTHKLSLEPRVTLLDALRESLGLTGTTRGGPDEWESFSGIVPALLVLGVWVAVGLLARRFMRWEPRK